jgi:hypothetical protein
MKIVLIVEGDTERAFLVPLRKFLSDRLPGRMPKLVASSHGGRIPKEDQLYRVVENLLKDREPADAVIALTDVYTGTGDFIDAADAKAKMRQWVGPNPKFHPHAAQYDFEAWLLPYWSKIRQLAKHYRRAPSGAPETINHQNPPAHRIQAIFEVGKCRDSYSKPRDDKKILKDEDLLIAANACPELKSFLNTILTLCGGAPIP